jgi:hypothetical protein
MENFAIVAALFGGAIVGALAVWALLRNRAAGDSVDSRQTERIRELEMQLHQKECDHVDEVTALKRAMSAASESEVRQAVEEARSSQREEFDRQLKSFSVDVSPYAEIREFRSGLARRYRKISGYQYQLFVNGVPAFDPHVVKQYDETSSSVDEEALLRMAAQAAELVLQKYAAVAQVLHEAAPVFLKLSGKKGDA